MSLVVHRLAPTARRADDDPFEGGFAATEGPMSLVVRS
jgi:hypothetical protein